MIDPTAVPIKRANMTPPPDSMPLAVLVVRPDGSQIYVPLAEYQSALDRLESVKPSELMGLPAKEKPCPPKRTATRRR
jgi:hypothetical protein